MNAWNLMEHLQNDDVISWNLVKYAHSFSLLAVIVKLICRAKILQTDPTAGHISR